jgi:hypothetical protein
MGVFVCAACKVVRRTKSLPKQWVVLDFPSSLIRHHACSDICAARVQRAARMARQLGARI